MLHDAFPIAAPAAHSSGRPLTEQPPHDEASKAAVQTGDSLDDLDFAAAAGFVGVVDDAKASERREDCIEPG